MRKGNLAMTFLAAAGIAAGVAGCQGRMSIPSGAQEVQVGSGDLSYTAHQNGNVYVLDRDSNVKVFEGQMKVGDQLVVKPAQDQIVLAGNDAEHSTALRPDHRYSIFFNPK